jgi:hypothetical protein
MSEALGAARLPTPPNPFDITKAVDFSDAQIASTWVDLPDGGFFGVVDPRSPMPRLLLGGKGSGRTHLMRYYSSDLQTIRHQEGTSAGFAEDGYLGIYFRASGLNSGRFSGKGIDQERWATLFMYYFDIWVAQHAVTAIARACSPQDAQAIATFCLQANELLDEPFQESPKTFTETLRQFQRLQREIDLAVNNAAMTHDLSVRIRSTPGRLVFGIPRAAAEHFNDLRNLQFLYLVDELENFETPQQVYLNTLIREKESPASFVIGSRLYGIKTTATITGELNRQGSEYEKLILDRMYFNEPSRYEAFCRSLVAQRLIEAGHRDLPREQLAERLDEYFEEYESDPLGVQETNFIRRNQRSIDLKHLSKLKKSLESPTAPATARNKSSQIIEALRLTEYPLLEKLNTFLLYQAWSQGRDLVQTSEEIRAAASAYVDGTRTGFYHTRMSHFRSDLLAQLIAEHGHRPRYLGFKTFVQLSCGLPRSLVVILKHAYLWALFLGETPFVAAAKLSDDAQRPGVLEASDWFFQDSPGTGSDGRFAQDAIVRLGNLLRMLRYSDKPVESSLCTIALNATELSTTARRVIERAQQYSYLIEVTNGQSDRNTGELLPKYQLHPMLSPKWGLPIARRGAIELSREESEAIFNPERADDFPRILSRREVRVTAPFKQVDVGPLL